MRYSCGKCGYQSEVKQAVQKHFNRKKSCEPIIANIQPVLIMKKIQSSKMKTPGSEIKYADEEIGIPDSEIGIPESEIEYTETKMKNPGSQITTTGTQKNTSELELNSCQSCTHVFASKQMLKKHKCKGPVEDRYKCSHCNYKYSNSWNLKIHLKTCKKIQAMPIFKTDKEIIHEKHLALQEKEVALQEKEDIITALQEELFNRSTAMPTMINTTNNTTNTTNNTTNNNIIIMTGYGNENVEHILQNKDMLLENIARASGNPVDFYTKAFKAIYFNPDYPENQNLKMTNSRGNLVTVTRKDEHGELYEDSEDQARFFPKILCDVQQITKDGRKNMNNEKLRDKADDLEREMKLFPIMPVPKTLGRGIPRPLSQIAQMEKQRDLNLKSAENERKNICTSLKNETIIETKKKRSRVTATS